MEYAMKTNYFLLLAASLSLIMALASPVLAQGPYFDIGLGVGSGTTVVDDMNVVKLAKKLGMDAEDQAAVDLGFKVGYGPIAHKPLYVIGELGGIGHPVKVGSETVQYNSYLIGPGVIYYPIPLVQLGASLGYSWAKIVWKNELMDENDGGGFAWNVSAAVDLGGGNHGCLIGLKYFNASNELKVSEVDMKSSMIGVFVRYAYRKKDVSLSE
jgi:hypothetical protein